MVTAPLTTHLTTEVITFTADGEPATFGVTVHNGSPKRASFQLTVEAAGVEATVDPSWYQVAPAVSANIPGGASTHFTVAILAVPPLPRGFSGTMNLTVQVSSLELGLEDRQVLRLMVAGSSQLPPRLSLVTHQFRELPEAAFTLAVQVQNLNRQEAEIHLTVAGLPRPWFPEGEEKVIYLRGDNQTVVEFLGQLPPPSEVPRGYYPFTVTATQAQAVPVTVKGEVQVLPAGHVAFALGLPTPLLSLPDRRHWFLNPRLVETQVELCFTNHSNEPQTVGVIGQYDDPRLGLAPLLAPGTDLPPAPEVSTGVETPPPRQGPSLHLDPPQAPLGVGESQTLTLTLRHPLPWGGWVRRRLLRLEGYVQAASTSLKPAATTLELRVRPVVPFWLQFLGVGTAIALASVTWWYQFHRDHQGPVNRLVWGGQGQELLSAGDDQTLVRWQIHWGSPWRFQTHSVDKAIRVAAYHPRGDRQLWAGFENGQIQGWDLLADRVYRLTYAEDDRVFDLAIPAQGTTLYSGHGSGLVLAWDITPGRAPLEQTRPRQGFDLGFAVQQLALAGVGDSHLVAAGRFNRLSLLDLTTETLTPLSYPPGDGNQFIWAIATALEKPHLLAVGDSQGRLSLWDLTPCLGGNSPCRLLDDWNTGHGGAAVQAVSLSADGCYLASGGEDGQVMVWPLNSQGARRGDALNGRIWVTESEGITAVALQPHPRTLWMAYGTVGGTVAMRSRTLSPRSLPPGECAPSSPW